MTLDEIAIKHGTDKATQHPVGAHGYTPHYAHFFDPIRERTLRLIEIGVGGGESIRTWLEFFPSAFVFGVDIVSNTNQWNTVGAATDPRYMFFKADQSDPTFWKCLVASVGGSFDVIIDDGGHYSNQVITSFNSMWKNVVPGGLYCIEDLGVAYGGHPFTPAGWQNHMDFIKDKLDAINKSEGGIHSLHFTKELAIFKKSL